MSAINFSHSSKGKNLINSMSSPKNQVESQKSNQSQSSLLERRSGAEERLIILVAQALRAVTVLFLFTLGSPTLLLWVTSHWAEIIWKSCYVGGSTPLQCRHVGVKSDLTKLDRIVASLVFHSSRSSTTSRTCTSNAFVANQCLHLYPYSNTDSKDEKNFLKHLSQLVDWI